MSQHQDKRSFYLFSAAVLSVAAVGFLSGTRPPSSSQKFRGAESSSEVEAALSYSEQRKGRRGPSADMYEGAFAWLRSLGPGLTESVTQTEEERLAALDARQERRAFAGAPPVIPHPIQEREAAACLACHGTGSLVGGLRAPMVSHKEYAVCVQCHAPEREEHEMVKALAPALQENTFSGVEEPGRGEVAWEGAPPTIPHATFMREECNSCHGPLGAQGLRTPHPVRANCTQCHAAAASFDQAGPPAFAAANFEEVK